MLPTASAASAIPAAAAAPSAFANAGTATSRAPNIAPSGMSPKIRVSIPALASAPARCRSRRSARQRRDACVDANASMPTRRAPAIASTAAAGEPTAISSGGRERTEDEQNLGEHRLNRVGDAELSRVVDEVGPERPHARQQR